MTKEIHPEGISPNIPPAKELNSIMDKLKKKINKKFSWDGVKTLTEKKNDIRKRIGGMIKTKNTNAKSTASIIK